MGGSAFKYLRWRTEKVGRSFWIQVPLSPMSPPCSLPLGDAASASFCLDGLWAQGQSLDMDRAQSRSLNIWTHSCPQNPGNGSDTTH